MRYIPYESTDYDYENRKKCLIQSIHIKDLPDTMTFLGLCFYGQTYFRLDREKLEKCYNEKINLLEYWGFREPVPMLAGYFQLVVECDGDFDKSNIVFNMCDDEKNIIPSESREIVDIDIPFYDTRINKFNYLRVGLGYGIAYNV